MCCGMVMKTPLELLPQLIKKELDSEQSLLAAVGDGLIAGLNALHGSSLVARVQTTVLTRTLARPSPLPECLSLWAQLRAMLQVILYS